ncbi:hypothetical protein Dimus_003936, partial [Dionaea muscipula]
MLTLTEAHQICRHAFVPTRFQPSLAVDSPSAPAQLSEPRLNRGGTTRVGSSATGFFPSVVIPTLCSSSPPPRSLSPSSSW